MNRRKFLKISTGAICSAPFVNTFGSEQLPIKYHKIIKDWSFTCGGVTNWNDFNIYTIVGLSKRKNFPDDYDECVLRSQDVLCLYVNKDRFYEISDYKGEWIENTNHSLFEVEFNIVKYLGKTPTERIIIISGSDYCIYALGKDYYKEVEKDYPPYGIRKGWILDKREVYRPLTEKMHSQIKYFDFNRKTYQEYLREYNTKLKELNLI